ncbi:mucin-2-like isoform X2 [Mytilus edulis]|uniref:mucin-2-like isoform X2 n=1 Tax=Mytilus edulis TaxID=6550 RepID=UPI0039F10DBE
MIYFAFFFFTVSAAVTEFPCTFPSPWINQTFSVMIMGFPAGNWQFNADCQTSTFTTSQSSETWLCHQITERFLVVRVQGSEDFACFPIFYNLQGAPFMFTFGSNGNTQFVNQTGEFTDICEICKKPVATATAKASSTLSQSCDIPSMCTSPGTPCSANDVIPKGSGCPIPTPTTTEPTTTTPEPTTTTPVPTTTPEPKTTTHGYRSHCRKRNHRHP